MTTYEGLRTERTVASSDGVHMLAGCLYLPPDGVRPKALLQIVHGMDEYMGRYDDVMRFFAQNGYIVFGYDHIGHGKTARDDTELGFFANRGGTAILAEDVYVFAAAIRADYPDLPWMVLGHSMGSLIVRVTAQKYGSEMKGLIASGTGGPNKLCGVGIALGSLIALFCGKRHISPLLERMAFGTYNDRTEHITEHDWLTHDPAIIEAYEADKFCTFHFTTSALTDLFRLVASANSKKRNESLPKQLPIYLVSGEEDPVGAYEDGVLAASRLYKACGTTDLSVKLWRNCRHETLNETCRADVYRDLLGWLNRHI